MVRLKKLVALGAVTGLLAAGLTVGTTSTAAAADVIGTPWTVGGNGFGQLGSGNTTARTTAAAVIGGLNDVTDLHGGREHVVALRANGTVWTWGSNDEGQLGIGTTGNRSTPVQVPSLTGVTAVETGHNYSLALRSNGTVWTWGLNSDGQLGDGSITTRRSPVQVSGLTNAVAIAGGRDMSYAIRADGTVVGWGRNDEGQIGDGTTTRRLTPVRVGTLTGVVRIAGGRDHGLAVRTDGSVWAWGSNDYGQLGDGTTTDKTGPVQVLTGASDVAAGAHHSYALRTDGRVSAWGRNYRTNLGDGTTTQRTRPVYVLGVSGAVTLGSLRDAGAVTLADGRAKVWGHNVSGQLGDGTTTNRTSAVFMTGVTNAVKAGGGGSEFSVILVGSSTPPANQDPTAAFTQNCVELTCSFDGGDSVDPDGSISSYAWAFGGGGTATGETVDHGFAGPGTYPVTLTVTDDDGATDSVIRDVVVTTTPPTNEPPVASFTFSCDDLSCSFDGSGSNDPDDNIASYAWSFGDTGTGTGDIVGHTFAGPNTYSVTLTVTDEEGESDSETHPVTVTAPPTANVAYRAATGFNGNTQQPGVTIPAAVRAGDRLLLFVTTNRAATATTPAGWSLLGTVSDATDVRSWTFTRTATAADAGVAVRSTLDAYSKSSAVLLAYADAGAPSATVGAPENGNGATHTAPAAATTAPAGSVVVRHWVDKVNATHGWTLPAGVTSRNTTVGSGSGLLTSVAGDSSVETSSAVPAATANAGVASSKAISWTVVLPPA